MKRPQFLIQGFLILCFGLASCSSDKGSGQSDNFSNYSLEIRNSDETIQKIKKTTSLRVSSEIFLEAKDGSSDLSQVESTVLCKTNKNSQPLQFITTLHEVASISVKNILPAEVFNPSSTTSQVLCDLNFVAHTNKGDNVSIRFKAVEILEIDQFSSSDWDILRDQQNPLFTLEQLQNQGWQWPQDEGVLSTLCEFQNHQTFVMPNPKTPLMAFPSEVFGNQKSQSCRLHFRSKDQVWLSPAFIVQFQKPKIKKSLTQNWSGNPLVNFNERPSLVWTLKNDGQHPLFFKLDLPSTEVVLEPAYRWKRTDFFNYKDFSFDGFWNANNLVIAQKGESLDQDIFQLSPGEEFEIHLKVAGGLQCSMGVVGGVPIVDNPPTMCDREILRFLQGHRYWVYRFPSLILDESDLRDGDHWTTIDLTPPETAFADDHYEFWAENKAILNLCPNLSIEPPTIGGDITRTDNGFQKLLDCQRKDF